MRPVASLLHRELTELNAHAEHPVADEQKLQLKEVLSLENIHFHHAGDEVPSLHGIDFNIKRGERVCIAGPSGGGKSTLLDIVMGPLPPTSGQVLVDGLDIAQARRGWQQGIGYVPQLIGLIDDTLRRNIALGIPESQIDESAVQQALRQSGLEEFVSSLPDGLDTFVGEDGIRLSGGQRQRIGIARALYHGPEVLVLDEPTSALDVDAEADILGCILEPVAGRTVLMAAHRPTAIAMCDRVIRLEAGRVVEDLYITADLHTRGTKT